MTEETLETIILGHIAKELKDEIQIGRQVNLAKTIMQTLRIHDVSGSVFFTTEEVKALKRVRNYFGEHDKTLFEHWAYSYLDNILKWIHNDR